LDWFEYDPFKVAPGPRWANEIAPKLGDLDRWFEALGKGVENGWLRVPDNADLVTKWLESWSNFTSGHTTSTKSAIDWPAVRALAELARLASMSGSSVSHISGVLRSGRSAEPLVARLTDVYGSDWVRVGIRSFHEEPREVSVYVALVDLSNSTTPKGHVARLTLGYFREGAGHVAQDPRDSAVTARDGFAKVLTDTFRLACSHPENRSRTHDPHGGLGVDGRWRLVGLPPGISTVPEGDSAGLAAYWAWFDCVGDLYPDKELICLAAVDARTREASQVHDEYIPANVAAQEETPKLNTNV
jgi:hypothetical protein